MRLLLSLLCGLAVFGCRSAGPLANASNGQTCPHRLRAVFDVGSGTTKLNLSEVAVCGSGAVELVRTFDAGAGLRVSLEAAKDADQNISDAGVRDLVRAVTDLKARAVEIARREAPGFKHIEYAAAGTHAFRTCRNPERVTAALAAVGVPIVRLTQAEEAAYGLNGAREALRTCGGKTAIVWDVGGGSMQFTRADASFRGLPLGAESFKARVIAKYNLPGIARCDAHGVSANPVGRDHVDDAIAMAASLIAGQGPFGDLSQACVIGVGGLHVRAVRVQIAKNWDLIRDCACPTAGCALPPDRYDRRAVECLARALADKTDCDAEVRGPYSGLAETNLLLVAGAMRALRMDEVRVADVNLSQGLVVDQTRLTFRTEAIP